MVTADLRRAQHGWQCDAQVFGLGVADGAVAFTQQKVGLVFGLAGLGLVGGLQAADAVFKELLECRAVRVLGGVAARPGFGQRGKVGVDGADGGLPRAG